MSSRPSTLIEVQGVTRRFGRRAALTQVDLEVERGQLVGLAGPNGSGKTTLLRLIAGLLRPTEGSVRVLGQDPFRQRVAMTSGARFVFAPPPAYEQLTGRAQALHLARLSRPRLPAREVDAALEQVGLAERARDRVREYSFGMRTRLALAIALVPRPELLVLDEPTDGLDPLAVLELRDILRGLVDDGLTVVLSSHLLIELEELVDRLLVLDRGKSLFCGAPVEWTRGSERVHIGTPSPRPARAALRAHWPGIELLETADGLSAPPLPELDLESVRSVLAREGLPLVSFTRRRASLETILLERLRSAREERS